MFAGTGDLVPYYALYALLFADHGFGPGQISLLLAIWSATAFVFEVPSGAWADTVSRRGLLILNGLLMAAGFAVWTVAPSFEGFALGFALWGVAGSLRSGTFEALVYDELAARDSARAYARVIGYTRSASESTAVIAILAATPLYLWGGYLLVGWVSVGCALVHTALAASLPAAPKSVSATEVGELEEAEAGPASHATPTVVTPSPRPATIGSGIAADEPAAGEQGTLHRYLRMLRAGVAEAVQVRLVRRGVVLGALLYSITAFDEYFGLVAGEAGVATAFVPLLVGVTVVGSLLGSLLAGRTEAVRARTLARVLGVAGVLFGGGALVAGLAVRWPSAVYVCTGLGFTAIAAAYGVVYNAAIVAEARLQDAISGPARATVMSVSGLLEELVSLAVFGFVALATLWMSVSSTIALLGIAIVALAAMTPYWLPPRPEAESDRGR